MHWQEFMRSVRVKAHQPRRTVPLSLILAILASIDVTVFCGRSSSRSSWWSCSSRSRAQSAHAPRPSRARMHGTPTSTGWCVTSSSDASVQVSGVYVLAVRFKSIKQDRRIERPEARGDHRLEVPQGEASRGGSDWSFVGDLPGHALSPFKWYRLLMG